MNVSEFSQGFTAKPIHFIDMRYVTKEQEKDLTEEQRAAFLAAFRGTLPHLAQMIEYLGDDWDLGISVRKSTNEQLFDKVWEKVKTKL